MKHEDTRQPDLVKCSRRELLALPILAAALGEGSLAPAGASVASKRADEFLCDEFGHALTNERGSVLVVGGRP